MIDNDILGQLNKIDYFILVDFSAAFLQFIWLNSNDSIVSLHHASLEIQYEKAFSQSTNCIIYKY